MIERALGRYSRFFFKPAARYPADPRAVFILILSVFSGLTAFALEAAPQSLEDQLPHWGVILWGVLLGLGSIITLIGMAFQSLNGIIAEQVGSVMVGATTIYYSILAINFVGATAVQTVGIILAWGIACFIRWAQLQSLINDAHRTEVHSQILEQVREELKSPEQS